MLIMKGEGRIQRRSVVGSSLCVKLTKKVALGRMTPDEA